MEWFAVRHVIQNQQAFEERVTIWQAPTEDEAIARAEVEATEYATTAGWTVLGLFQCYSLPEPPADGSEVFSLIRRSPLSAEAYLDAHFDSGEELQRAD